MVSVFCFLMIRRPPISTPLYASAASDVYKRQQFAWIRWHEAMQSMNGGHKKAAKRSPHTAGTRSKQTVSYTHLRAHETSQELVCRLLLEQKNNHNHQRRLPLTTQQLLQQHTNTKSQRQHTHTKHQSTITT